MELYIIILKGIMNRKMKGIKVKDLKIECEYFDCEIPQEYLEKTHLIKQDIDIINVK